MRHPSRLVQTLLAASVVLVTAPAEAQTAAPETTPKAGWGFSAFVRDPFDAARSFGLRRRLVGQGALSVSGSAESERREFGGPAVETRRLTLAGGYRHLIGSGRLKGLVEVEGRYTKDDVTSSDPALEGTRDGKGAGAYLGFEYFVSPWMSFSARAGLDHEERDEAGGTTRRTTTMRPSISMAVYW